MPLSALGEGHSLYVAPNVTVQPYCGPMSNETRAALTSARQTYMDASASASKAQDALLARLASDLPSKVDAVARRVAESDVQKARSLGKERLDEVRGELRRRALTYAEEIRQSRQDLPWRGSVQSSFGPSRFAVMDALRSLYTREVIEDFVKPLQVAGFAVQARNYNSHDFFESENYEAEIDAVVLAVDAAKAAQREVDNARRTDDQADLSDLWT
jgi:hypothetical protein